MGEVEILKLATNVGSFVLVVWLVLWQNTRLIPRYMESVERQAQMFRDELERQRKELVAAMEAIRQAVQELSVKQEFSGKRKE